MRWLAICLSVCATVTAIELRCENALCSGQGLASEEFGKAEFTVEGHVVEFLYKDIKTDEIADRLDIDCGGWQAFDSPAMPRFADTFRVSVIYIYNCSLPAGNGSLATALAALNVKLQPVDGRLSLELLQFPAERLASHHFDGLEELTTLKINGNSAVNAQRPIPEEGFLTRLQKLRILRIGSLQLPAGEIQRLPQSLNGLWLSGASLQSLPGTLPEIMSQIARALPNLRSLILMQSTAPEPENPDLISEDTVSVSNSVEHLKTTYSLGSIYLLNWEDSRFVPFEQCGALRTIKIEKARVEELPERWIAGCPLVSDVILDTADKLTSLPTKLLEGATALKRLSIESTAISSLPAKFLKGAPNLVELDLSNNRIQVIPSDAFLGPALQLLNLEGNQFSSDSLASVASLTSLNVLKIGKNKFIYNLCDEDGYSPLKGLTQLKTLTLSETQVSRICRDWRENLVFLESIELIGTNITELKGADFQYTRDASVEYVVLRMSTSVNSLVFTKTDYENTVHKTKPGVAFRLESYWSYPDSRVNCDCSAYWLRRLIEANHEITVDGLRCANDEHFEDVKPEDMCSDTEITAA